ncbi:MAG: transcriptional repressor LexA [Planctomycetes bacterium]|nr:transcriptional repressor LexA [Planctomycetota bacterium]
MQSLTDRQRAVLETIRTFMNREGLSPSLREIARAMDLDTKSVAQHLDRLERKGYITRRPRQSRNIRLAESVRRAFNEKESPRGLPLVGQIAAGQPILAEENLEGHLTLEDYFESDGLGPESGVFLLRVRGESMKEAGIRDGDLVAVRSDRTVRNGEIAVVVLDNEATVKRFYHEGAYLRLEPENPGYGPIVVDPETTEVRIIGPVLGLVRKM